MQHEADVTVDLASGRPHGPAPRYDRRAPGYDDARPALNVLVCGSPGDGSRTIVECLKSSTGLPAGPCDPDIRPDRRRTDTAGRNYVVAATVPHACAILPAAATADVAVLALDARAGPSAQTRRVGPLLHLLGVRRLVLAVNKMDLVDGDRLVFERIVRSFGGGAVRVGQPEIIAIPMSARTGGGVRAPDPAMPWYRGPTLMQVLDDTQVDAGHAQRLPARLPVKWAQEDDTGLRSYGGRIASGALRIGQRVRLQPSGCAAQITRIVGAAGDVEEARAGQEVMVTLVGGGGVGGCALISAAEAPAQVADRFHCTLAWASPTPLVPGRPYLLRLASGTAGMTVTEVQYRLDVATLERVGASQMTLDDLGACDIALDHPMPFDAGADNRATGSFIVIDGTTQAPVGAGLLQAALRRANDIHLQHLEVTPAERSAIKGHRPALLWLTGLSGAGKSTIANVLEKRLLAQGRHTCLLDGDNVRHGLNKDLGFTAAERVENIRRVAEVGKLMVDAGLIVIAAFISPFRAEREMARRLIGDAAFVEIHVDTPLDVAELRDTKGLYRKARAGGLKNFTGIDSPYEPPLAPEVRIDTTVTRPENAASLVIDRLRCMGIVD